MTLAVTDANIFIDLVKLRMLGYLFSIELQISTTREVIDQLNEAQAAQVMQFVQAKNLTVYKFTEAEIAEINLMVAPRALEFTDKTVIYLAKNIDAIVLTGDGPLRKFCKTCMLPVKGILWLFDTCLEKEKFTYQTGVDKIKELMSFNDRIPKDECEKRIQLWQSR